jgi:hypothetical protein
VAVEWFQDDERPSFKETILGRARPILIQHGLTASDYPAFRRVANLIRTRQGRPDSNPAPLIAATRDLPDISINLDAEGELHGSAT